MKKIVSILILLSSGNILAQKQWWPSIADINIPAIIETNGNSQSSQMAFNPPSYAFQRFRSTQIGDSVYINCFPVIIHFLIDTLNKALKNFELGLNYSYSPTYNEYDSVINFFIFSELNFHISGDSLIVNDTGNLCKDELQTAYYYYWQYISKKLSSESSSVQLRNDDDSAYRCKLIFVHVVPQNSVTELRNSNLFFISELLSNTQIKFSFPSFTSSLPLLIYDILGREVYRAEIEPGMTQYLLPSARFTSGHYFARLGNMTAHFEVP